MPSKGAFRGTFNFCNPKNDWVLPLPLEPGDRARPSEQKQNPVKETTTSNAEHSEKIYRFL